MKKLKDKLAVITGAGSGIGEAIAKVFAEEGAYVILLDTHEENGLRVTDEIKEKEGKAEFHYCDVSYQEEVRQVQAEVSNEHGAPNILINNAGVPHIGTVENTTEGDFERIFRVNVKGVYNCMHVCVPLMLENGGGAIINMASVASSVGIQDRFAYSMSKGAVWTMTLSVAKDYIDKNLRCNAIAPARVHTPFVDSYLKKHYPGQEQEMFESLARTQPIGRMATPEEIASLAVYLCSDEASFITGSLFPIDGGFVTLNT